MASLNRKMLKDKRRERKLTQESLAERLGVTERSIRNIENGTTYPNSKLLADWCEELQISVDAVLYEVRKGG